MFPIQVQLFRISFLTYCLFNDAVSISDCRTSNGSMINVGYVRSFRVVIQYIIPEFAWEDQGKPNSG